MSAGSSQHGPPFPCVSSLQQRAQLLQRLNGGKASTIDGKIPADVLIRGQQPLPFLDKIRGLNIRESFSNFEYASSLVVGSRLGGPAGNAADHLAGQDAAVEIGDFALVVGEGLRTVRDHLLIMSDLPVPDLLDVEHTGGGDDAGWPGHIVELQHRNRVKRSRN
jgi:hypothetical protein